MKMKRETLKKILNFVITVLTAVASAFVCRAASSINPLKIQHYENIRKYHLLSFTVQPPASPRTSPSKSSKPVI